MSKFVTNLKGSILTTALIGYGATLGFIVADSVVGGAVRETISDAMFRIRYKMADNRNARLEKAGKTSKVCFSHEIEALNRPSRHRAKDTHKISFSDTKRISPELRRRLMKAPAMSMEDLERKPVMEYPQ